MKLYYSPGACSQAPHIVALETGSKLDLIKVDTSTHKTADGSDFYAINPKGYVPLLELDDGSRLSEGPVICQYLADKAGNTELMPAAGTIERYRVMEWQNYITAELHKTFSPLFNPTYDASVKKIFSDAVLQKLGWVDEQLKDRDYLTGKNFTAADAYLFVVARWTLFVKLDISGLAHLNAFLARVAARPKVHEALKVEGLVK
ncbi:MAG: glutathione transferase GstA [Pseudomonadota bacterium]|nr:glutathione transferase GstA [Pseudomonadota bacterium]